MRYLTIQRNKSFVGCLMKLKVYVEDPLSGEIKINGVPCRKAGVLKNGEQQTFMIGDEALRIYVIADKLSKNYCNEFYEVPAGTENVFISGSCQYNPLSGNAFRFDGVPTEEMKKNRKKATKKGIVVLAASVVIGIIIGIAAAIIPLFMIDDFDMNAESKMFTYGNMTITLDENFTEEPKEGFDVLFSSTDVYVFVDTQTVEDEEIFAAISLDDFSDHVIKETETDSQTKHKDGLTYYEYENDTSHYWAFSFKGSDTFYFVQFGVLNEDKDKYADKVFEYAKSIKCE